MAIALQENVPLFLDVSAIANMVQKGRFSGLFYTVCAHLSCAMVVYAPLDILLEVSRVNSQQTAFRTLIRGWNRPSADCIHG